MIVKKIRRDDCENFILNIHYAKRWPLISYAYGLFDGKHLLGVVTYGQPPSPTVRKGIAGIENEKDVLELNRLCLLHNRKNEASMLVGGSLRLLPKNKIIISFADTGQEHLGTVYQACNFIYTGLSMKVKDWAIKGKEHLHPMTISDEFKGFKNRKEKLIEKYGDKFYYKERDQKHRYIYIIGSKTYKKRIKKELRYEIKPYPKNEGGGGIKNES